MVGSGTVFQTTFTLLLFLMWKMLGRSSNLVCTHTSHSRYGFAVECLGNYSWLLQPVILRELGDDGDETLEDDSNKLLEEEEINPDMILEGAKKVRQIYLKAKDGKVIV